jgi:hypothetical protein
MAYDQSGARIGAAGHFASRMTAALIASGGIEATPAAAADTFADLTADCLTVLNGLESVPTLASTEAKLREAFPGTVVEIHQDLPQELSPGVRIIGGNGDPAPAWLYEEAKKAGVTAVFDNREDLQRNPKLPWFKQAEPEVDSQDRKPFWPPRAKTAKRY